MSKGLAMRGEVKTNYVCPACGNLVDYLTKAKMCRPCLAHAEAKKAAEAARVSMEKINALDELCLLVAVDDLDPQPYIYSTLTDVEAARILRVLADTLDPLGQTPTPPEAAPSEPDRPEKQPTMPEPVKPFPPAAPVEAVEAGVLFDAPRYTPPPAAPKKSSYPDHTPDPTLAWWSTEDVAAYIRKSVQSVHLYHSKKEMPAYEHTVGRRRYWRPATITAWHNHKTGK